MARQFLSEGIRAFIKEKIQTVLRLEVLLLLHRHRPRAFTAAEVANELGFENEALAEELRTLQASGLLVQSNTDKLKYRYHPLDAKLESMIDQLANAYSNRRVPILSVMLAEHPDRARLFAEAFRIIRRD